MTPGFRELLIILAIVLLLFGARKLPDLARSLGKSVRIFRREANALRKESELEDDVAPDDTSGSTEGT